ncbi:hypothetical protein [Xanthomonas campestris]|uniref:hypothetical protein n=1 Tax=Xanthomonas campestris TaxID=339 RepID=UPI000C290E91|nr:hypothetical protein [Xanthomonas campestris]MCD0261699.1 hypothetical protein [Xanthomonas campestris pv. campestris]MCD0269927.1 hypothetical protein [Xanthomonas campestris pv. campestris]PJR22798.1 hypothetical protein ASJ34_18255 [Xanthomonas campestris pv. campestris]
MDTKMFRTVVFEITDAAKGHAFIGPLIQAMGEYVEVAPGVRVTAVSMRDEITAIEALEAGSPPAQVRVSL